jgi:hypothetical protein
MESIEIVRRRLVIPEPKELWTASAAEKKGIIIEAKRFWAEFRSSFGFNIPSNLSELVFGSLPNSNQKLDKSEELIFGLSLAQSNLSGINVCWWSSPECRKGCVGQNWNKTRFLFEHPEEAGIMLADFWMKADSKIDLGHEVGGRPNTFSDINWIESAPWIFERFKRINFYDYTKDWNRVSPFSNYHLTYSASERTTDEQIIDFVSQGKNVAVVFSSWTHLPSTYLGFQVVNGDIDDVRWKDPDGVIVGLKRKGSMKASSPMVRDF